jgi:hypothetical protein
MSLISIGQSCILYTFLHENKTKQNKNEKQKQNNYINSKESFNDTRRYRQRGVTQSSIIQVTFVGILFVVNTYYS